MDIKVELLNNVEKNISLSIIVFSDKGILNNPWPKAISAFLNMAKETGFKAKKGEIALEKPFNDTQAKHIIFIGAGEHKKFDHNTLRDIAGTLAKKAPSRGISKICLLVPKSLENNPQNINSIAEGIVLGSYKFDKYKTKDQKQEKRLSSATLVTTSKNKIKLFSERVKTGKLYADATNFARDLVNEAPSELTPEKIAKISESINDKSLRVKAYRMAEIKKMGMGALLGLARGSSNNPTFTHIIYKPKKAGKKIALVGKGVTFDSGGLNIKTKEMEIMKMDMSGAACVLAVMKSLPQLRPNAEVHGIIPATENMPDGNSLKPGDILKTLSGKTIEVLNTDAEGRLILTDGITYAKKQAVNEIIDIATLTGACIIALGHDIAGLVGNNQKLIDNIIKASSKSGEKAWQLPLEMSYKQALKSQVADIKNISNKGTGAGTITGALFLEEFVGSTPWVHIDIAGPAWKEKPASISYPGGTGSMVRTLLHYLSSV